MKLLSKHLVHYLVLFGILTAGFAGLVLFSYDRNFQISVAAGIVGAYISWGIVHHYLHNDLYLETVIEYMSVALLGLIILLTLI